METYVPDTSKPRAWLFDVDGTLAEMNGRRPFEWHRVGEDLPRPAVLRAMHLAAQHDTVLIMSGRDSVCRRQTELWLDAQGAVWNELFMRPEGDYRKDAIVKAELFDTHVRDRYWVQAVYDDRDQVVEMWRAAGLNCFQVQPGAF